MPMAHAQQQRLFIDAPDTPAGGPPRANGEFTLELLDEPVSNVDAPPELTMEANPFLSDHASSGPPSKRVPEPFSGTIEAGKNTYVYDAHPYHTKVPPEGIKRLIEYYTAPGAVVLDPFAGSGMTGIAATETGRRAILVDLSPAAAFIAYNLLSPIPADRYLSAVKDILTLSRSLELELYGTTCRRCGRRVPLEYSVWSATTRCPSCGHEFLIWDVARDEKPSVKESKIKTQFPCPRCGNLLHKRLLPRLGRKMVQVGYFCCGRGMKELTDPPDHQDLLLVDDLDRRGVPKGLWYPSDEFPDGVNTRQAVGAGITRVCDAYTTRNLWALAYLWSLASRVKDRDLRLKLLFTLTSLYKRVTLFSEFRFWGGSGNTPYYNVPAIINEQNVFRAFYRKAKTIALYLKSAPHIERAFRVSVQSSTSLPQLPDESVDYVFTDPPFGANINYSEMNFLWESWLRVKTDPTEEAIINKVQGKDVRRYSDLLAKVFREVHRVLKKDAWMTVMFHNSSAEVWEALHAAVVRAGFVVRGVQIFDRRQGTFKQFVSDNAVGYDLLLHCQKGIAHSNGSNGGAAAKEAVGRWVKLQLAQNPERYIHHYLHVKRRDELDYRKLYSEWLTTVVTDGATWLSFSDFRAVVDRVVHENPDLERHIANGGLLPSTEPSHQGPSTK